MSHSQDYAPNNTNLGRPEDADNTEPADPNSPDHSTRRELPLAPSSVKPECLPEPFVTDKRHAVTMAEAGKVYLKVQRSNWQDNTLTSKYECHKNGTYPQILGADRHFQATYSDVTTVMLTRRLSPLDDSDSWLTPWECNEMLHGGKIHRSIRRALNYQLDGFEFEWIAVTAPTRSAGTPHEHIYLWIDDPNDDVTLDHIQPALDKHLKYCPNAYKKHHQYRVDGTDGAIRLQHSPDRVDSDIDTVRRVVESDPRCENLGQVYQNTAGAQYLASQLTHLPVGDYYDNQRENPPQALFEGAALAWTSPYNWFRASGGVPS